MTIVPLITEHSMEYDPLAAEFDRGWDACANHLGGEYRRGFTDALLIAFIFFSLGAALVATITAVYA